MQWVKLYTDILGDVKLMRAARKGAKGLSLLPWFIAFAGAADDDGRLTVNGEAAEPDDIAATIPGETPRSVAAALASCAAIGVLVTDPDGALRFNAWASRAGKPSDRPEFARERKRRQRDNARVTDAETVTPSHAGQGVTGHAGRHAIEVEVEKEGEEEGEGENYKNNYLPATPDGAPEGRTSGAALPAAPAPRLEPAAVAPAPAPAPLPALALVPLDLETPPAGTPAGTPAARQSAAPRSASPKGAAKATPKAPEKWPGFTKADCDTLFATWREFGEPNYGRFRNTFGPLFPESGPRYPVERVVKAIKEAIEEAKSKGGYDLRTLTPDTFVARVGYWVEQSSMPVVDDWGNPTARGIRYGMIA